MNVYCEFLRSGHPSEVVTTLNRALGQFSRWHGTIYIGVTGSPTLREKSHERNGWGEMVYLYRTGSRNNAYDMETSLIDHCRSRGYSANTISGGSGLRRYDIYYVCMLLE